MPAISLSCFHCGQQYPLGELINLCECGKPLSVDYDLPQLSREALAGRRWDMWRYAEVLPLEPPVSLGEGGTPLIPVPYPGIELLVKEEGLNPTGSFKARGMAVAVAMAAKLGATKLAVPSAGNAGGALAAYAALHFLEAHIFMPSDVPAANRLECEVLGAQVTLVDGLITDCARIIGERKEAEGWFDVSTLKEPYRVEGKKTMGYEIAEQLGWVLPDSIIYPTGGGTGLVGMAKAFDEMEEMGWLGSKRPKMFSVQAAGCAPIVRAYEHGWTYAEPIEGASTIASGLRVPRAIGDFILLDIIRRTGGAAVSVTDDELMHGAIALSRSSGIFICPEGGACYAALAKLRHSGHIQDGERAVIFNTGTGAKYEEAFKRYR